MVHPDAIVWIPGSPFHPAMERQIAQRVDAEKSQAFANGSKSAREIAEKQNAPAGDIETVVKRMFAQLGGLDGKNRLTAVAHFLAELKERDAQQVNLADKAMELAKGVQQMATDHSDYLTQILGGYFAIIKPIKTFERGAQSTTTDTAGPGNGEAVVSKRSAD